MADKRRPRAVSAKPFVGRRLAKFDEKIRAQGFNLLGGADESGRGALAGPLIAAAVILPPGLVIDDLNDCKKLLPKKRDRLYDLITGKALAWRIMRVEAPEIDEIGLHRANLLALEEAVLSLKPEPEYVVTDRFEARSLKMPHLGVTKGDCTSASIAAASIIAKVTRDRIMATLAVSYPQYGFDRNKGYGTEEHLKAIKKYGPSPVHRKSFSGVEND